MKRPLSDGCIWYPGTALSPDALFLRLASLCNTGCRCCSAGDGPVLASPCGRTVTGREPAEARRAAARNPGSRLPPERIEISGRGEPLLLADTFALLRRLIAGLPRAEVSVWTNGLLLPDRIEELARSGAAGVHVSIPAAEPQTAAGIYDWVVYRGRKYAGRDAAELMLRQQWTGLAAAVQAGLAVTVYIASVPGVTEGETNAVRQQARLAGVERIVAAPRHA